ncbi:MAG: HAD family hydrolase [Clostridia bacterium]|nr:HAD family hydrolase [Clostridia bacterium]
MNNKEIKIVALDLDGTTLDPNSKFTKRTIEAFYNAMEKGVHIVVSTGRTFKSLPEQLFHIPGLEYVVTSNGAHITKLANMERIYENIITPEAVRKVVELLEQHDISAEIFIDGVAFIDKSDYDHIKKHGSGYRDDHYVLSTRRPVDGILDYLLENKHQVENISLNFPLIKDKEEFGKKLKQIPGITVTSSFAHNYEIGGETTSKAEALRFLMKKLGLNSSQLMACGDSPNDEEMIKLAEIGVVMGNASEEMKARADYVTDSNAEDGVAKAIEKFVLKESK